MRLVFMVAAVLTAVADRRSTEGTSIATNAVASKDDSSVSRSVASKGEDVISFTTRQDSTTQMEFSNSRTSDTMISVIKQCLECPE